MPSDQIMVGGLIFSFVNYLCLNHQMMQTPMHWTMTATIWPTVLTMASLRSVQNCMLLLSRKEWVDATLGSFYGLSCSLLGDVFFGFSPAADEDGSCLYMHDRDFYFTTFSHPALQTVFLFERVALDHWCVLALFDIILDKHGHPDSFPVYGYSADVSTNL